MLARKRETSGIRRNNKIIDGSFLDEPRGPAGGGGESRDNSPKNAAGGDSNKDLRTSSTAYDEQVIPALAAKNTRQA